MQIHIKPPYGNKLRWVYPREKYIPILGPYSSNSKGLFSGRQKLPADWYVDNLTHELVQVHANTQQDWRIITQFIERNHIPRVELLPGILPAYDMFYRIAQVSSLTVNLCDSGISNATILQDIVEYSDLFGEVTYHVDIDTPPGVLTKLDTHKILVTLDDPEQVNYLFQWGNVAGVALGKLVFLPWEVKRIVRKVGESGSPNLM